MYAESCLSVTKRHRSVFEESSIERATSATPMPNLFLLRFLPLLPLPTQLSIYLFLDKIAYRRLYRRSSPTLESTRSNASAGCAILKLRARAQFCSQSHVRRPYCCNGNSSMATESRLICDIPYLNLASCCYSMANVLY